MSLLSLDNLDQFVQEYNYYWNHAALYERFRRKTTPVKARSYLESWFGKSDLIFIYSQYKNINKNKILYDILSFLFIFYFINCF